MESLPTFRLGIVIDEILTGNAVPVIEPIARVDTLKNQGFNPNCIVLLPINH